MVDVQVTDIAHVLDEAEKDLCRVDFFLRGPSLNETQEQNESSALTDRLCRMSEQASRIRSLARTLVQTCTGDQETALADKCA